MTKNNFQKFKLQGLQLKRQTSANAIRTVLLVLILFQLNYVKLSAQQFSLTNKLTVGDEIVEEFMDMKGFTHFEFDLKSENSAFVNVYIEEYCKDSLIGRYNHFSDTSSIPREYYSIAFPRTAGKHFRIRVFGLADGDSVEQVRLRIGGVSIQKKIRVRTFNYEYEWKIAKFDDTNKPRRFKKNERIPLLYYTTAITTESSGTEVQKYCETSEIIDDRTTDERIKRIKHYFIIGIELTDKL